MDQQFQPYGQSVIQEGGLSGLNKLYARVYGLVGAGIGISALVSFLALYVFQEQTIQFLMSPSASMMVWLLIGLELVLVFSASISSVRNGKWALPLFLAYSVVNGLTLSITLLYYNLGTITSAFVAATVMFAAMAVIGATTKKDLSGIGKACMAALIGIVVVSLINIFTNSAMIDYIVSVVGVVIFAGLIAYDNQTVKVVYNQTNGHVPSGLVVNLALNLYLDFINVFLYLLRLFGSSDD